MILASHPVDVSDQRIYFRRADGTATTKQVEAEQLERTKAFEVADTAEIPAGLIGWFPTQGKVKSPADYRDEDDWS